MVGLLTSAEEEKKILEYIKSESSKKFYNDFNAKNLSLFKLVNDLEINEENILPILDKLEKEKKIISMKVEHEIWLSTNTDGKEIEKFLRQKKMALYTNSYWIYSVFILMLLWILLDRLIKKNYFENITDNQFLFLGIIFTIVSIYFGKKMVLWFYSFTNKIELVPYYKPAIFIIVLTLIVIIGSLLYDFSKIWAIISGIFNILSIIYISIQLIKEQKI